MKYNIKNTLFYVVQPITAVLLLLLMFFINSFFSEIVNSYRTWQIMHNTKEDIHLIERKLVYAESQQDSLRSYLEVLKKKDYPDLQTLKQLATKYNLRLRKMEQISKTSDTELAERQYSAILEGSISKVVLFVKELEDVYIFKAQKIIVRPSDETGSLIALYLDITVKAI